MKPQRRRCQEWIIGYWQVKGRCNRPITHRVVGRWKRFPGQPERVLMCDRHADDMVRGNTGLSPVTISAYRIRRPR